MASFVKEFLQKIKKRIFFCFYEYNCIFAITMHDFNMLVVIKKEFVFY